MSGVYFPRKYNFHGIPVVMKCLMNLGKEMKKEEELFICTINKMSRSLFNDFIDESLKERIQMEKTYEASRPVAPKEFEISETAIFLPRINGIQTILVEEGYEARVEISDEGIPYVVVENEDFPDMEFQYDGSYTDGMDAFMLTLSTRAGGKDPAVTDRMILNFDAGMLFAQVAWDEETSEVLFMAYQPEDSRISTSGALKVMVEEMKAALVSFDRAYEKAAGEVKA